MKKCPFCAEEIQEEAVKCRYCGEFIKKTEPIKWYFKTHTIIIGFLSIGPLVLPLLWFHPILDRRKKIIYTCIMLVVSYFLFMVTINSIKAIGAYYNQLSEILSDF